MESAVKKIKIVFLTDCFADLTGGAERQVYELAKGLDKSKYEITIASLECDGQTSPDLMADLECHFKTFRVVRIYGLLGLLQGVRFRSFLKKEKIDILQTYHFGSDIWGTFWGHLAGVKVIISSRRDIGFWRNKWHIQAYCFINRWVHKILTNSIAGKNMVLQDEDILDSNVDVINNGVELPAISRPFFELKKEIGIKENDIVIAHVANLRPVKGHAYLLQALAGIISQHKNIKLLLIGEDRLNGELQALAGRLNIESYIRFLGKRDDVAKILSISDICVLPSLSEGMSNAILEYMAHGKPIIATRVGGTPELVEDGKNGFLVEKENAEELKSALIALIENPQERKELGENGFKKVKENFSMQGMIQKHDSLFVKLSTPSIKVLHLISSSGLFGAENIILSLGSHFNQNGMVSVISALNDRREPHVEILDKAKEFGVETYALESSGKIDLTAVRRLKKYLVKNKINLLHTHNYKSDMVGLMASWLVGIPVVATAHGFTDASQAVSLYEKIDRFILKKFFKKVVVVTERILPDLDDTKRVVIANGLDIQKFSRDKQSREETRHKLGVKDSEVLIGNVGRLSKEKNQSLLLDVATQLIKKYNHLKFLIVGDGITMADLKTKVKINNLEDRVIFTGVLTDLAPVYQAMDIFVLPSLTEGIPLVILEAMASKVPVVATCVGGIPDIIQNGMNGLLVASNNADELASTIEELLNNKHKQGEMTEKAFRFVEDNFSQNKMFERYKNLYKEVLN